MDVGNVQAVKGKGGGIKSKMSRTRNQQTVADMKMTFDSQGNKLAVHKVNPDAISRLHRTLNSLQFSTNSPATISGKTSFFLRSQIDAIRKKIDRKVLMSIVDFKGH